MKKTAAFLLFVVLMVFSIGPAFAQSAPSDFMTEDGGFSWDPNPEADLAGYELYIGKAPGKYDLQIDVGNVTSFPRKALQIPDGTYFAALKAYDFARNKSGFSDEVIFKLDSVAPEHPKGFRTVAKVTVEITISVPQE